MYRLHRSNITLMIKNDIARANGVAVKNQHLVGFLPVFIDELDLQRKSWVQELDLEEVIRTTAGLLLLP